MYTRPQAKSPTKTTLCNPKLPTQTMASKLSLKLVLNKNTGEVFFGEAGKEFIDFLFSLLALPIGYVAKLLTKQHMAGCTGSLYNSLENLTVDYLQPNFDKNTLLNPKMSIPLSSQNPPLLLQDGASTSSKYYSCGNSNYINHRWIADVKGVACPSCNNSMFQEFLYVRPKGAASGSDSGGGCVKGVVTYMVMDDLVVTPMSTISSLSLLNKYQVRDLSALKEKVVEVGMDEGLALLKASLESKTVLTDVFGEKSKNVPGTAPMKSSPASSKRAFTGGFQVKLEPME
ncbi:uncharacterized protein LOC131243598 isoform X2 [Magnolia sinica]|uniref:uncharacterized protein LOC131243598 isoform X2 n=1 Tax=Magnolia sinica TaxID=86752 RepID=UPI00265AE0BD|nr:uncharacterized protein LOC131243598 isoform X2 [Magnolia sinica]